MWQSFQSLVSICHCPDRGKDAKSTEGAKQDSLPLNPEQQKTAEQEEVRRQIHEAKKLKAEITEAQEAGQDLVVGVISAQGLPAMDKNGKADPYVQLKLLDAEKKMIGKNVKKTKKQSKTLDPVWNEKIVVDDAKQKECRFILFEVMDKDGLFQKDDFIGTVELSMDQVSQNYREGDPSEIELPIQPPSTEGEGSALRGTLVVNVAYEKLRAEVKQQALETLKEEHKAFCKENNIAPLNFDDLDALDTATGETSDGDEEPTDETSHEASNEQGYSLDDKAE